MAILDDGATLTRAPMRSWLLLAGGVLAFALVALDVPALLPAVSVVLFALVSLTAAIGAQAATDSMLLDLRERGLSCSDLPPLPTGWSIDTDLRSARGGSFSGDFIVTAMPRPGRLELVLVDVSGSGPAAGARALVLAVGFEALLDSLPAPRFLAAANQHVLRHADDEGFATAVQLSLDLASGQFEVTGAGHPPVVQYRAGSGRWQLLPAADQGPALGLLSDPAFPGLSGRLGQGDALLLYTDGLVESRRLDVERGLDRLLGQADLTLARGQSGPARKIMEAVRAQAAPGLDGDDDRALVVIRRS